MQLTLVTSSPQKAKEIAVIFPEVQLHSQSVDIQEIQSFDLKEVVQHKVKSAYQALQTPVLVEDVSLEFQCLNGFPGPFVKFWAERGGYDVIAQIVEVFGQPQVVARCGVGYADGKQVLYTEGVLPGTWVKKRAGEGFGFDFYFIPQGYTQTMSEMGPNKKNTLSHRALGHTNMRQLLIDSQLFQPYD